MDKVNLFYAMETIMKESFNLMNNMVLGNAKIQMKYSLDNTNNINRMDLCGSSDIHRLSTINLEHQMQSRRGQDKQLMNIKICTRKESSRGMVSTKILIKAILKGVHLKMVKEKDFLLLRTLKTLFKLNTKEESKCLFQ